MKECNRIFDPVRMSAVLLGTLTVLAAPAVCAQSVEFYATQPDGSQDTIVAKRAEWHGTGSRDYVNKLSSNKPLKFFGHGGHDDIVGTPFSDVFVEEGGTDEVRLKGGDDIFRFGGKSFQQDKPHGGDGTDKIVLSEGDDVITLKVYSGIEIFDAKGGYDILRGNHNKQSWNLASDFDEVRGLEEIRLLEGHDDFVDTDAGHIIRVGSGENDIYANGGTDTVIFPSPKSDYTVSIVSSTKVKVTHDPNGYDSYIYDAEKLVFDGGDGAEVNL